MAHHGFVLHPGEGGAHLLDRRPGVPVRDVLGAVGQPRAGRVVGESEHPHRTLGARDDDAVARPVRGHLLLHLEGADHRLPVRQVVLVRTEHHPAHGGAHPVRADHEIEVLVVPLPGARVLEQDPYPAGVLGDLDRSGREPHLDRVLGPVAGDALPQRGLDVAAQHRCQPAGRVQQSQSRLPLAPAIHRPGVPARSPFGVAGVEVVGDSQVGRGLHTLREHEDEVAPGTSLGCPFDDHRRPAGLAQPDGRGHPRDAEPYY